MNGRQFVYHMEGLTKTYPPAKKVLDNIHLSFYPCLLYTSPSPRD